MFGLKPSGRQTWKTTWHHQLSEYVTQVVWSPDGTSLAACSAAGEIMIQSFRTDVSAPLEPLDTSTAPIDQLAFSADGQFLAAGNQAGQVQIWVLQEYTHGSLIFERGGHIGLESINEAACSDYDRTS